MDLRLRKYFILWDIVNPIEIINKTFIYDLYGEYSIRIRVRIRFSVRIRVRFRFRLRIKIRLDSVRGSTISHKMKYLPKITRSVLIG